MLTIDQREIAGPGTGVQLGDGRSSFRRILVPVRSPGESAPALAAAARICGLASGVLRLVHVRTCDPPQRSAARFYRETTGQATAVLEEALLAAWACGGPRATTSVVDARHGDVAVAIAWQAAAWPADLIVLTRRPRPAIARLVGGSVAHQVMRKASCPVLAVPLRPCDAAASCLRRRAAICASCQLFCKAPGVEIQLTEPTARWSIMRRLVSRSPVLLSHQAGLVRNARRGDMMPDSGRGGGGWE